MNFPCVCVWYESLTVWEWTKRTLMKGVLHIIIIKQRKREYGDSMSHVSSCELMYSVWERSNKRSQSGQSLVSLGGLHKVRRGLESTEGVLCHQFVRRLTSLVKHLLVRSLQLGFDLLCHRWIYVQLRGSKKRELSEKVCINGHQRLYTEATRDK